MSQIGGSLEDSFKETLFLGRLLLSRLGSIVIVVVIVIVASIVCVSTSSVLSGLRSRGGSVHVL